MSGQCKSCALLVKVPCNSEGKANGPKDDYRYACTWRRTVVFSWAEKFLEAHMKAEGVAVVGKTHVEGEWSDHMDCPTWVAK